MQTSHDKPFLGRYAASVNSQEPAEMRQQEPTGLVNSERNSIIDSP